MSLDLSFGFECYLFRVDLMVSKNRVTKIRETATSGCWFEQQRGEEIRFSGYTSIDSSLRESYYMSARNPLADIKDIYTTILLVCPAGLLSSRRRHHTPPIHLICEYIILVCTKNTVKF